jgi:hypothetical protein
MDLKEFVGESVVYIHLSQDPDQARFCEHRNEPVTSLKAWSFVTNRASLNSQKGLSSTELIPQEWCMFHTQRQRERETHTVSINRVTGRPATFAREI